MRALPTKAGNCADELTPHTRDLSSGRTGKWPYWAPNAFESATSSKPGAAPPRDLSAGGIGRKPQGMRETLRQSKNWNQDNRAEYGVRVSMAKTVPAATPSGCKLPSGPTKSTRAPITKITGSETVSANSRNNTPGSAEVAPGFKTDVAGWRAIGVTTTRNEIATGAQRVAIHRRRVAFQRGKRLEQRAPHCAVPRVERRATHSKGRAPP